MIDEKISLIDELSSFGNVRESGCMLCVQGDEYVMEESRNITNQHRLHVGSTDSVRLEAHWKQFVRSVRNKVPFTSANTYNPANQVS